LLIISIVVTDILDEDDIIMLLLIVGVVQPKPQLLSVYIVVVLTSLISTFVGGGVGSVDDWDGGVLCLLDILYYMTVVVGV